MIAPNEARINVVAMLIASANVSSQMLEFTWWLSAPAPR
jgi:hypothetical protein